ncbi:MAG: methyltransferase domain-containing protein [Pseudomonadota bacterium]
MAQDASTAPSAPPAAAAIPDLKELACPQCQGPLCALPSPPKSAKGSQSPAEPDAEAGSLQCTACGAQYPALDGMLWLLPEAQDEQARWRNRWHHAIRQLQLRSTRAQAAALTATTPATEQRLQQLAAGCAGQQAAVTELLGCLDLGMAGSASCYEALRTDLPQLQQLFSYEANLFRDWCWGGAENRASTAAVLDCLEDAQVNVRETRKRDARILVLGSGGARLAYDLHRALVPARTFALERNPYLAYAGAHLCQRGDLNLWEFPLAPLSGAEVAVERTLHCPDPASAEGLVFLMADALAPPVPAGSIDLVVTPWFIDVCGIPPSRLARIINRVLKPGGLWLNHGSVAFQAEAPEAQLTASELHDEIESSGFSIRAQSESTMPYLCSPASRHGRRELVHTFCAARVADCAPESMTEDSPSWLQQHHEPVPQLPAFARQASDTAIHAFLMSLIDGQRSVAAMAEIMAARQMLPAADARVALAGFLQKMYAEANGDVSL